MLFLSRIRQRVQSWVSVPNRNGLWEAHSIGVSSWSTLGDVAGGRLGHGQPQAVLVSADEVKQVAWQMRLAPLAREKHGLPCSCETPTLWIVLQDWKWFASSLSPLTRPLRGLPASHLGTPLKYGKCVKYFHPGASHALVSKGRKCGNLGWKRAPDWLAALVVRDRVGRAEEGTDAHTACSRHVVLLCKIFGLLQTSGEFWPRCYKKVLGPESHFWEL